MYKQQRGSYREVLVMALCLPYYQATMTVLLLIMFMVMVILWVGYHQQILLCVSNRLHQFAVEAGRRAS
jgi:hypothetical protein